MLLRDTGFTLYQKGLHDYGRLDPSHSQRDLWGFQKSDEKVLLSAPASQVKTKCLFSVYGDHTAGKRNRMTSNLNHRLRGSASPVLTATGFVNGKGQFSTPHRIDTPQPITKNFITGDYVADPYGCAELAAYPSTGGFWAHGWNITKIIFIYALF